MILTKIVLLLVLAVLPMVPVVLALPWVSPVTTVALVGFWLLNPSWGSWLYVGICLNLMQWRVWQIYVKRLRMSVYVSSPSMAIQNSTSMWLSIGAVIGGIRSFAVGDLTGTVLGGLVALLLFGLQGILFPNPSLIWQVCGGFMLPSDEVERLVENLDYPTVLRLNRQARKGGIQAEELARILGRRVVGPKGK